MSPFSGRCARAEFLAMLSGRKRLPAFGNEEVRREKKKKKNKAPPLDRLVIKLALCFELLVL